MESFFLSETCKYLFLLFSPPAPLRGTLSRSASAECVVEVEEAMVFNTEAHMLDPAAIKCCSAQKQKETEDLARFQDGVDLLKVFALSDAPLDSEAEEELSVAEALRAEMALPRSALLGGGKTEGKQSTLIERESGERVQIEFETQKNTSEEEEEEEQENRNSTVVNVEPTRPSMTRSENGVVEAVQLLRALLKEKNGSEGVCSRFEEAGGSRMFLTFLMLMYERTPSSVHLMRRPCCIVGRSTVEDSYVNTAPRLEEEEVRMLSEVRFESMSCAARRFEERMAVMGEVVA